MRYIVTVKDRLTGFACLNFIPRKRPMFVVYELQHLFGVIGFLYIFNTDNRQEFIAKEVTRFLKFISPSIDTVTRCPRTPNDQGSVEYMNCIVKLIINSIEEEDRQAGKIPNWTMYLGREMSAINSIEERGYNGVSSCKAVYGFPFGGNEQFPLNNLRKYSTVTERMNLVQCP
jgi:hypothetical protein